MDFTLAFFAKLGMLLLAAAPLLIVLVAAISGLALWVGQRERWSLSDSLYYGFITATTVGYGDLRPTQPWSKAMAVVIAVLGLMLMGIVVALTVEAVALAYGQTYGTQHIS